MAAEDAGLVLGKPVEVVSADTQLKPDIASAIARRWYDAEGINVITDLPTSAMTFAVMDLARERKEIVLATSASSSDITGPRCSPYVAHWVYDTYSVAHSTPTALAKQGAKTWFFISQDTVAGAMSEGRDRGDQGCGRHGGRFGQGAEQFRRLFVVHPAGQSL